MRPDKAIALVLRLLPEQINPVRRALASAFKPFWEQVQRLHPEEKQALDHFLESTDEDKVSPLFGIIRTVVNEGPDAVDANVVVEMMSSVYSRVLIAFIPFLVIGAPIICFDDIERHFAGRFKAEYSHSSTVATVATVATVGIIAMIGIVLAVIALRSLAKFMRNWSSPTALKLVMTAIEGLDIVRSPSALNENSRRKLLARIESIRVLLLYQLPFFVSGPSRSARDLAYTHGWRAADHLSEVANAVALPSDSTWGYVEEEIAYLYRVGSSRNWGDLRLSPRFPESRSRKLTLRSAATTLLVASLPPVLAFGVGAIVTYPLQDKAQVFSVLWFVFTLWRALDPNLRETLDAVRDGSKLFGYGSDKKD